jgi:UDP-N-acetyl-alpha-D-quinovosamine dehydrogenase
MNILLTGGTGLIGRALYPLMREKGYRVKCALRKKNDDKIIREEDIFYYENLDENMDWSFVLNNIDAVIHLAARVPVEKNENAKAYNNFFQVNFQGTKRLAQQAAKKNVKRFIFISTIGVLGISDLKTPLTEKSKENPNNNYAISKQMAEHALISIGNQTGMEVVILRPPLVYGPYVKANFLKLLDCIYRGIPLPFDGVKNQRNFIALENVIQAISACIAHKKAVNGIFIISDDEYISTRDLIRKISNAMGKPARIFNFPVFIAKLLLIMIGKKSLYNKLWGSLRVESKKIKEQIGWTPKIGMDEGIQKTVEWYLNEKNKLSN